MCLISSSLSHNQGPPTCYTKYPKSSNQATQHSSFPINSYELPPIFHHPKKDITTKQHHSGRLNFINSYYISHYTLLYFTNSPNSSIPTSNRQSNIHIFLKNILQGYITTLTLLQFFFTSHASAFQTNSLKLANATLSMTLSTTRSTTMMISKMKNDRGIRLREAGVLRDCLEELNDAVSELQESIKEMGHNVI